jgi:hypothetical protein
MFLCVCMYVILCMHACIRMRLFVCFARARVFFWGGGVFVHVCVRIVFGYQVTVRRINFDVCRLQACF